MDYTRQVNEGLDRVQEALEEHVDRRIDERLQPTEKWISKVESQVNTARSHSVGGDGILDAIPAAYRKHIEIAERHGYKDAVKSAGFGLWWNASIQAARAPIVGASPARYLKIKEDLEHAWGEEAVTKAALGEVSGTGNLIIATPVEAYLMRMVRDNTVVRGLSTQIVMESLTHQVPVENLNVTAYIVPETTVITDSMTATSFAQRALTAKAFAGLATVSQQLLDDNVVGLQQYLFASIGEHIGILEDQGALDGGTPTVQNFSGIAVAPGVNSFAVNGTGVSGGSAPTYAELLQAVYTAAQSSSRVGGAFFMLPAAFKNIAGLVDSTGQPIFTFGTVPNNIPTMLGGYPVYMVSSLSSAWSTATTSTNIYFGPPSKILYGDILGMRFDVDPYSLLDRAQVRVRVYKRTAITVPVGQFFTVMKGIKYV